MNLLTIKNLQILNMPPFNFTVKAGECLAITGESGCGKSLFLRAVADLDPHPGLISLNGKDANSFQPWQWRRQVGLLPSESSWWFPKVKDHFPGDAVNFYQQLSEIGLKADILDTLTHRLSSGERQRLSLLRLLRNKPQVLLLDEPTANLDANNSALVERVLKKFQQKHGCSLLWVTHDVEQAHRVADRQLHFTKHHFREIKNF